MPLAHDGRGTSMQVEPDLITAFQQGRCAVFVGAGVSIPAKYPSWDKFVKVLADDLAKDKRQPSPEWEFMQPAGVPDKQGGRRFSAHQLMTIPQYYLNARKRAGLNDRITEAFSTHKRDRHAPAHRLIAKLPTDLFYTTNLDPCLENALDDAKASFEVIDDEKGARFKAANTKRQFLRKIHGTYQNPEEATITRDDFAKWALNHPVMAQRLHHDLMSRQFLFLGYSLRDPDFTVIYDQVAHVMRDAQRNHFACLFVNNEWEKEDLKHRGIVPIDLKQWGSRDDALVNFLTRLVEQTSDAAAIRDFFRGVETGSEVPIVVQSKTVDHRLRVPLCDVHTTEKLRQALVSIGAFHRPVADKLALDQIESVLGQGSVILVCGPSGNDVTEVLLNEGDAGIPIRVHEDEQGNRHLYVGQSEHYVSPRPADPEKIRKDVAFVARFRNHWSRRPGEYVYVFAGLRALGTRAIGDYVARLKNFRHLQLPDDRPIAIFDVECAHDNTDADHNEEIRMVVPPPPRTVPVQGAEKGAAKEKKQVRGRK